MSNHGVQSLLEYSVKAICPYLEQLSPDQIETVCNVLPSLPPVLATQLIQALSPEQQSSTLLQMSEKQLYCCVEILAYQLQEADCCSLLTLAQLETVCTWICVLEPYFACRVFHSLSSYEQQQQVMRKLSEVEQLKVLPPTWYLIWGEHIELCQESNQRFTVWLDYVLDKEDIRLLYWFLHKFAKACSKESIHTAVQYCKPVEFIDVMLRIAAEMPEGIELDESTLESALTIEESNCNRDGLVDTLLPYCPSVDKLSPHTQHMLASWQVKRQKTE